MRGTIAIVGTTLGSFIGWWLGSYVGFAAACFGSVIGTGIGLYAARRAWQAYNEEYL